ncbi:MAG: cytochrome P450 [Chloroflexi bacterium HGW-Chloroflexi-9]|nr:MAG: cytochrome P450 [Chloroflexi bacterium HGW-Chloroflexi-9]
MTTAAVFNPFVPSYRKNPYLQLGRLREADPVHFSAALQAWILTRYEDCLAVMRDHATFSSDAHNARGQLAEALQQQRRESPVGDVATVLGVDPPRHTEMRAIVNRAFTPRRVQALRPRIEEIARELLATAPVTGDFELMTGLAQPLPVIVIAELLGVPAADRGRFKHWSNAIAATTNLLQTEEMQATTRQAVQEVVDYLGAFIRDRQREPREDLISVLVAADEGGRRLSPEEILAFAILLLVAGNETTTNLIGNGMAALLEHPEALARLREEPDLLPVAVEELLRYDSPVQGLARFTTQAVEMHGRTIAQGDVVLCMIGSANHDPAAFVDPDALVLDRDPNRHLSFGQGIHFCLGAPLARLEADIAFRALLDRWRSLSLAEGGLERGGTLLLRGPERLLLRAS